MPRRVNKDWSSGKGTVPVPPAGPSAFETEAKRLSLTPENYASSRQLRAWCEKNSSRCYIPEWLLKEWDIRVDSDVG